MLKANVKKRKAKKPIWMLMNSAEDNPEKDEWKDRRAAEEAEGAGSVETGELSEAISP